MANNISPPKLPLRIFRWFCHPDYVEDIEGDLIERYHYKCGEVSELRAQIFFFFEVIKLLRTELITPLEGASKINQYGMFKHNIKVSVRSFRRYKISFFVNLLGLLGGLVTALFIYLWVHQEVSMDKFHANSDQLYRLVSDVSGNETLLNTSPKYANQLAKEIPEIELLVNSSWGSLESFLIVDENVHSTTGEFGGEGFFQLFSYPLIHGNRSSVLKQPNSIALSESTAMRLFNRLDVIGTTLEWRWYSFEEEIVITGIYEDPPSTSSAHFDYVLSFDVFEQYFSERIARGNRNGRTFLKLTKKADLQAVNNKINDYSKNNYPESNLRAPFLISYSDYYLHNTYKNGQPTGGRIALVRLFAIIGMLILVIACVNFMNLSTARAALRTKEIGVRKVLGAQRKSLILQYLTESCLISFLAGLTAIGCIALLFTFFQQLTGRELTIDISFELLLTFFGITLITGLLSGSYPALYLSGFKPLRVLKGQLSTSIKDQWFRKGLVVFQFGVSLILIISVLVIYRQMNFIQTKNLGYTNEEILNFDTKGMSGEKQRALLTEARKLPGVVKASSISHALFGAQKSSANITWDGKDPDQEVWFEWGYVGYDMLELLEIEMLQGRPFSIDFGNEQTKVVINETTKKLMEVKNPIGKKLTVGDTEYEVIGVTHDFNFQSLHESIKPTFFVLKNNWSMKLAMRVEPENMSETILQIEKLYAQFNPGYSFGYTFHDQDQKKMYRTEEQMIVLSKYAAGLAIFISCLGLFGLISFVAERKSKEMGIRKILGASSSSLTATLSKDFVSPILVAGVIGLALSIFVMDHWLDEFAYRITMEWWLFAAPLALMLLLAMITSSTQIIRALFVNPINSLRDE